ncbi:hypothetical protein [Ottowia beijingensis]|uniref:hypothetical protein n=1 Tax=Ottowia beijingensis TaxID=1207057 RepID=UPI003644F80E
MKLLACLRDFLTYSPEQETLQRVQTISDLLEIHRAARSGSSKRQPPRPVVANSSVGGADGCATSGTCCGAADGS